jgi:hypothetical protein
LGKAILMRHWTIMNSGADSAPGRPAWGRPGGCFVLRSADRLAADRHDFVIVSEAEPDEVLCVESPE